MVEYLDAIRLWHVGSSLVRSESMIVKGSPFVERLGHLLIVTL